MKKKVTHIRSGKSSLYRDLGFSAIEQYKVLRTNLLFTLPEGEQTHIIGVTSPVRNEGKSTTSVNLAFSLAEAGKRVLLIDADMRLPSVAKKLGMIGNAGLSAMLLDPEGTPPPYLTPEGFDTMRVLTAGSPPPNPSELLASTRMKRVLELLREQFEYIILDLPPVNIVSDAIAVSPYLCGMVLVIREDATEKKELASCARQLELSGVKILGAVLNSSKRGKAGTWHYRYQYGDGGKIEKN